MARAPKKEPLTEDDILKKVIEFHDDAVFGSANKFDRMAKAERFRTNDQWDRAVKEEADRVGKFALTIPLIKPAVKQLVGSEIQNPKDVKVMPTKGGTHTIAKVLTALAKHAMDTEQVRFEKTMQFEAGAGVGAGYLGYFIDRRTDPKHANLIIKKLDEFEVIFDPNCKVYDPNDSDEGAKYLIWAPWESKDKVEAEYPDKSEELQTGGTSATVGSAIAGAVNWFIDTLIGTNRRSRQISNFGPDERVDIENREKHRYRKIHTWWKEWKEVVMWFDSRESELDATLITDDKLISAVRKATKDNPEIFSIEEVVRPIMHHTIRVGNIFLEDRVDELNGIEMFPIVPVYGDFVNGITAGIVEDMISSQEIINWSESKKLNIIKKLADTGLIINDDPSGDYADWLKAHAGEDGIILQKSKAGGSIEQIAPPPYPIALDATTQRGLEFLKLASNVRTEDPNLQKTGESGRAIVLKQQAAAVSSAPMFGLYDYSTSIAGNLLIEIIRRNDIYSRDEIREIIDTEDLIDPVLMNQARQLVVQQFEQAGLPIPQVADAPDAAVLASVPRELQDKAIRDFQESVALDRQLVQMIDAQARPIAISLLLDQLDDWKKGTYNTKVSLSRFAVTYRLAKQAEVFELSRAFAEGGQMPLPRQTLVEASDIADKEKVLEDINQQEQQMAQAQSQGVQ